MLCSNEGGLLKPVTDYATAHHPRRLHGAVTAYDGLEDYQSVDPSGACLFSVTRKDPVLQDGLRNARSTGQNRLVRLRRAGQACEDEQGQQESKLSHPRTSSFHPGNYLEQRAFASPVGAAFT